MMFRNITVLILSLVILGSVSAQNIYLKMDEACMNRLEYLANNSQSSYISYSFKLGDKYFATFDVGVESNKGVQALPGKLTFCNALKIDRDFVNKVNNGSVKLYIVKESATQYFVSEVDKASFLASNAGTMDFATDDAQFSLNLNNPLSGVNLALPGSKSEVYLDGTINYQCLRGYIIQKKEARDSRSFKEYVIVPELGLVERSSVAKSGFVDDMLRDNVFKLSQVDGTNFQSVLSSVCDRMQATYYDAVTGTTRPSSNDTVTPKSGSAPIPTSYGGDPCAPTTESGVHVVQKGETLYSLSKRYGVQVAQIQGWNNLANSTTISICQRLWVKEPSTTSTAPQTTEKGGTTTTTTTSTGYWTQSSGEHSVRAGETVASLAKMYGFTEERFRKMNGLSLTETILPGQRLRTNDCNCPTLDSSTKGTPLPYDQPTETITSKETPTTTPVNKQDVYYRPISVYVVQASDTFFKIAQQYNTTVERILELNGMTKNDKLTEGMRIYVQ